MKNIEKMGFIALSVGVFFISYFMGETIYTCFVTSVLIGVGAFLIRKFINNKKKEKLKKSYEMDLPDLMIHIAMFIEAGLDIKEALKKAAMAGDKKKPLYKELFNVFEMERKIGSKDFSVILQEVSEKQKVSSFSNFSALIIQNMRKGSDELSEIFMAQAQLYRNERKRIAGKLADEAATLLLIPSAIVLIALVVLLLAPAVMTFLKGF